MGLEQILYKISAFVCSVYLSDSFDLNAVLFAPFQFILVKKKKNRWGKMLQCSLGLLNKKKWNIRKTEYCLHLAVFVG